MSQQELLSLRQELQSINDKIGELEMEADEHRLVIAALTPLPPTRKCFRKVGGILVEGDVASTLPVLDRNLQGIEQTTQGLKELWRKKEEELNKAQARSI